jgi:hypothetical protein
MKPLSEYISAHTERGDCKCGQCIDTTGAPDPAGHTVDMVFFKVAKVGEPTIEEFRRLTEESAHGEFCDVNPFDGQEHNFMELGAWLGDQGLAMLYMGLGTSLGAFTLLSPAMLGLDGPMAVQMAQAGLLSIQVKIPIEVAA